MYIYVYIDNSSSKEPCNNTPLAVPIFIKIIVIYINTSGHVCAYICVYVYTIINIYLYWSSCKEQCNNTPLAVPIHDDQKGYIHDNIHAHVLVCACMCMYIYVNIDTDGYINTNIYAITPR
jgi:hypothetical protein